MHARQAAPVQWQIDCRIQCEFSTLAWTVRPLLLVQLYQVTAHQSMTNVPTAIFISWSLIVSINVLIGHRKTKPAHKSSLVAWHFSSTTSQSLGQ